MKYGELNLGQIEAIVNKLGGMEGALRFLRGETSVVESEKKWREHEGVIYLSVISDGTTGPEWIARLESKGYKISNHAKGMLHSKDFKPTLGVATEIAVLKGIIWNDNDLIITENVRTKALELGFSAPNAEVACLIRENFSDEEIEAMGLYWIVIMHEPTKDSGGGPLLLRINRDDDGSWLAASRDVPGGAFYHNCSFAFVV